MGWPLRRGGVYHLEPLSRLRVSKQQFEGWEWG